ncbi:hypothetical protein Vadar_024952 [Vaccinium darrowii]|uniref:Uncharacterized protein n=1 Tax=Vaccinium darrowii TaxID=229202 RepID=A0ACB7X3H8_9ERIC|nr:hypothetical protein Vadar_024952 [Vaccinium darrowii]
MWLIRLLEEIPIVITQRERTRSGSIDLQSTIYMGLFGFDSIALMGPVKGFKKRRKVEPNVSASGSSKEGSLYGWDVFSKRIAGREGPYLPRLSLSLSQPPELYPEKQVEK